MVLVLTASCSKPEAGERSVSGAVSDDASGSSIATSASPRPTLRPAQPPPLPPLRAESKTIKLPLEGLGPATVEVPVGATEPRPVVVAVHGHSVRPEHACENWRLASGGDAFVLCPFGLPADAKPDQIVTLGSEAYTLREIDAGLAALRSRFGNHVAPGPVVYAGYSLGARRGVGIVAQHGDRFRRVALGEGGYEELRRPALEAFVRGGVERLLLVCSSKACEMTFARVKKQCDQVGLPCQVAPSGENPHLFAGKVVESTRVHWPWLVAGAWRESGSSDHER